MEVRLPLARDPQLDPALARTPADSLVVEQLFLGLTEASGGALQVTPELATSWEALPSGLEWTFRLREDAFWTDKDGRRLRPLQAQDVVYSLQRLMDPALGSPYASLLVPILAGAAEGRPEELEVEAEGEHQLRIRLARPAPYLPALLSLPGFRPVPREAVDLAPGRWTEPDNLQTSGAYRLVEWRHNAHLRLQPNPHFYSALEVGPTSVLFRVVPEEAAAEALYQLGQLDSASVPDWDVRRLQADPRLASSLREVVEPCLLSLVFRADQPPADQAVVRRALSAVIDREALARSAERPALPAASPVPHGLLQEGPGPLAEAWLRDPQLGREQAPAWLEEAGLGEEGQELAALRLWHPAEPWAEQVAARIAAQWGEALGVEVQERAVQGDYASAALGPGSGEESGRLPPHAYLWRQCDLLSYPHPASWLLPYHREWGQNLSRSAHGALEALLNAAWRPGRQVEERLYDRAGRALVVEEARMAPLYYHTRYVLTHPWLFRTFNPLWLDSVHRWNLDPERRSQDLGDPGGAER